MESESEFDQHHHHHEEEEEEEEEEDFITRPLYSLASSPVPLPPSLSLHVSVFVLIIEDLLVYLAD